MWYHRSQSKRKRRLLQKTTVFLLYLFTSSYLCSFMVVFWKAVRVNVRKNCETTNIHRRYRWVAVRCQKHRLKSETAHLTSFTRILWNDSSCSANLYHVLRSLERLFCVRVLSSVCNRLVSSIVFCILYVLNSEVLSCLLYTSRCV